MTDVPRHPESIEAEALKTTLQRGLGPGTTLGRSRQASPGRPDLRDTQRLGQSFGINIDPIEIGLGASATDPEGIAFGNNTTSAGAASIAEGLNASVTGDHSIAQGESASVTGNWDTAIGPHTICDGGDNAITAGLESESHGNLNSCYGPFAKAWGDGNASIGNGTTCGSSGHPVNNAGSIGPQAVAASRDWDLMLGSGNAVVIVFGQFVFRNSNGYLFKLDCDNSGNPTFTPYTYP